MGLIDIAPTRLYYQRLHEDSADRRVPTRLGDLCFDSDRVGGVVSLSESGVDCEQI